MPDRINGNCTIVKLAKDFTNNYFWLLSITEEFAPLELLPLLSYFSIFCSGNDGVFPSCQEQTPIEVTSHFQSFYLASDGNGKCI